MDANSNMRHSSLEAGRYSTPAGAATDSFQELNFLSSRIEGYTSSIERSLGLSDGNEAPQPGVAREVRPVPPPPVDDDWASYSTFFRGLPYIPSLGPENPLGSVQWNASIGYGASFIVKPFMMDSRLIGQPRLFNVPSNVKLVSKSLRLSPDEIQNIKNQKSFSKNAKRLLNQLCLEVLALTHPPLASHRNIIRLFGFSRDREGHDIFPSLIVERQISVL